MTKTFCDWCSDEIRGAHWYPNPLKDGAGEVCLACLDLVRRVFEGKKVLQVTALLEGGIEVTEFRHVECK